ncbi:FtsK/SpoIIIE domain-containing protein [Gordonia sp. N1V]|uniref:FtsK/SpoIIIE domain-containing protein n=1 Tax=Gordonia sp. N1V TaxID=3034163 RepID=UPI0023E095EE|nr:FtsK/SpoIIIE domain-containing protein [Gordonia sp. N1V]MDF3284664.1 FtsK/SpoIIIE domain-containing protein [Gordonia sp. N1V]
MVRRYVPGMRNHIEQYRRHLAAECEQLLAGFPDISAVVEEVTAVNEHMKQLMAGRFPDKFGNLYHSAGGPMPPAEVWVQAVRSLITDLQTRRVPMTSGGREKDWQQFSARYKGLSCNFQPIQDDLHKRAFAEALRLVRAASGLQHNVVAGPELNAFPAADLWSNELPRALSQLRPGLGPLMISLGGKLAATEVDLTLEAGDGKSEQSLSLATSAAAYPAILDLGRAGGFRTTAPLMAERVILQLLASLPADQLTIRVFDPLKLGDSAAFLYGLDDVMDRVIGDKVKTTDREIDELLQETEEHITRVTQKYLQGEHATLTDYNIAAKMVTEPYRILLLYGFPAGFQKQNHLDHDRLERLAKIIDGGSRAGVFTIVVSDDAIIGPGPTTPSTGGGSVRSYIDSLPCYGHGLILDGQSQSYLVGTTPSDMTIRLQTMKKRGNPGFRPKATYARLGSSELEVSWSPVVTKDDDQPARREQLLARIKQNFQSSTGTVIRPGWVAALSDDPRTAHPYRPDTWWRNSSAKGVAAGIGQLGATKIAHVRLHSEDGGVGALIGGRPGSGKSVLMHALIMSLVIEYSPRDLELYLIDFKEGVEFKRYADHRLPHAKAVAIDAEREFGVAVLEGMVSEIERRGELFKSFSSNITKLDDYRNATGEVLARQIAIIDEFQKLFERDDKIAQQASHLIERILREGRAFGLHIVLASQTIQGMQGLDRHVLSLVPTRIALRMSAGDSELILGESNTDARELTRAGEGIINIKQGHPDANERFQTTLWHDRPDRPGEGTDAEDVLAAIRAKSDEMGVAAEPRVYAGDTNAALTLDVISAGGLPIGLPVSLAPALSYELRREGGAHLLVVNENYGPILASMLALMRTGARIRIIDFVIGDDDWSSMRTDLERCNNVSIVGRRGLDDVIGEVATVVEERVEFEDYNNPAEYLVLFGLHRARDLDADNDYDEESANSRLTKILRDGSEVGVHVLAWSDRGAILNRRMSHKSLREFGLRLVGPCSPEDSQSLLDSDAGATLKRNQAVFDDHERGVTARVLAYGMPEPDLLGQLVP